MKKGKLFLTIIILIIPFVIFFFAFFKDKIKTGKNFLKLPPQTNQEAGITFKAFPLEFDAGKPVQFEIEIDAHSGSLDFNLAEMSFLEDGKGNVYKPTAWQGSEPGGHHRSGLLSFPKLNFPPEKIKLVVQTAPPRIFEWNL